MTDFEKEFERPAYATGARATRIATVFKLAYGWMCAGLALSGLVAWYTASNPAFCQKVIQGPGMWICIIAEIAMVCILSASIRKLSVGAACLMFIGYAALNGLTLSVVFVAYPIAAVERVFLITAAMFGGLAVFGTVTKSDLSQVGAVCGMALWGLIVAVVVNMFFHSSGFDWIVSFAGVLIFSGLTMWDAQKIKLLAQQEGSMDAATRHKVGLMGALELYLDFINLFIYLLRILGRSRD
ncbi:MAG: Bax inhibitor-1/YccA family protein [Kiritimatiellae bacterium]|jgi:FtsH-binding integral membrane protein|nr:Bax inhibitor-1/YccA family protein [Kiritimatiellia bacterium]